MVLKVDDGSLNLSGCTTLEISFKYYKCIGKILNILATKKLHTF